LKIRQKKVPERRSGAFNEKKKPCDIPKHFFSHMPVSLPPRSPASLLPTYLPVFFLSTPSNYSPTHLPLKQISTICDERFKVILSNVHKRSDSTSALSLWQEINGKEVKLSSSLIN
jgi:hypothetical protein